MKGIGIRSRARALAASFGAAVLAACLVVEYAPLARGRMPFPADIVLQFPPWSGNHAVPRLSHPEEGDIATQAYPWRVRVVHELHRLRIPLWNDAILIGCPMLANNQSAVFDPVNLATSVLPGWLAWSATFPIRVLLAGVGAALLADALGATVSGAWLAGIVFAFSGFLSNWRGRSPEASGLWLPLVLYALDRLSRRGDIPAAVLAGVVGAFPLLGGQPEVTFQMALAAAAFALFRLASPPEAPEAVPRVVVGRRLLFAGLLAAALCLLQLAPTVEWLMQLNRELHPWGHFSLRWIGTFLSRNRLAFPEHDGYAGMITLFLVPFAFCGERRRDAIFFGILLFAAVEIVYGLPPFSTVSDMLPVLSGLPNGRFLLVADLSLAVLAGLGLSALEGRAGSSRARSVAIVATALFAVAAARLVLPLPKPSAASWRVALSRSTESEVWILLGFLAVCGLAATRIPRRAGAAAVLVVAAADLLGFQHGRVPLVPRDQVYPRSAPLDRARRLVPAGGRVVATDGALGANFEMMYGLKSPTGYDFPIRRTARVLTPFLIPESNIVSAAAVARSRPHGLFDLFGARVVFAASSNGGSAELERDPARFPLLFRDHALRAYANRTALPRAFFLPESAVRSYPREIGQLAAVRSRGFDATRTLVLEGRRAEANAPPAPDVEPLVAATEFVESAGKVSFAIDAPISGYVVVTQSAYPGWVGRVDGRPVPLVRADYAFQGLPVGPGRHRIVLRYRPMIFWMAFAISSVGWLGVGVYAAALWRNRRREPPFNAPARETPGSRDTRTERRSRPRERSGRGAADTPARREVGPASST